MKRFLLLLLLLPILAFGSIGKITVLKGDVKLKRGADTIAAKSGTLLEKKDFITTDKDGKVQIVFNDKTIFTLGKSSTLDIADFLYDEAKPKKNKAKFNVLKGAFSTITGRIGKLNKSKFKLKTKSASIGIRGTIVLANQEFVMCTEGAITVETPNGIAVRVEAGQKTNVSSGTPTAPEAIQPGDTDALDLEVVDVTAGVGTALTEQADEGEAPVIVTPETPVEPKEPEDPTAEEVKNVKLTGRTIDSTGKQETLTIEGKNIQGDFSLSDSGSGLQMTDDSGNNINSTPDTTISWGHWESDPSKKWVAGETTDVKVLDAMRNNAEQTVESTYSGKVMGSVDGTDNIKMDSTNQVQMNFELGAGKNNMDGSIGFETESGQEWGSQFTGTTSGTGFSSTTMSGSGGEQGLTSGGVDGQFYGENAEAVGGTFQLNTNQNKATGVFKADKQ